MHVVKLLPSTDKSRVNKSVRDFQFIVLYSFLFLTGQAPHDIIDGINDGSVEIPEE